MYPFIDMRSIMLNFLTDTRNNHYPIGDGRLAFFTKGGYVSTNRAYFHVGRNKKSGQFVKRHWLLKVTRKVVRGY